MIGAVYRAIPHKAVLHLALLLHNLREEPPAERRAAIGRSLVSVLKGEAQIEDLMKRSATWSTQPRPAIRWLTEVWVDNETSDRFTILDVCADDRQGILYVMTNVMFQLGLSVHQARISTRLDQVADVFYVTDNAGWKIEGPVQLETIRIGVRDAIERFLDVTPTVPQGYSCAHISESRKEKEDRCL